MKIVLSPAKNIETKELPFQLSTCEPVFEKESLQLAKKLSKWSYKKIAKTMGVSEDIAKLNYQRYQGWDESLGAVDTKFPAISLFNGEVYRGLEVGSWSEASGQFAQENLRILSGLYGLLKPMDAIQPYRLEMGLKWAITPKTKSLYAYWGKKLANQLLSEMGEEEVLINLASAEYYRSIQSIEAQKRVITPIFQEIKNGKYRVVMTFAKQARGRMARYIIENQMSDPKQLLQYEIDGYRFEQNRSTDNEWIFTR